MPTRLRDGPFCVTVLLSLLIAGDLLRLTVALVGGHPGAIPAPSKPPVAAYPRRPRLDLSTILAAHVFGVEAGVPDDGAIAPASSSDWVLEGVLARPDPHRGVAIIRGDTGVHVYGVGAPVGGAVLRAVFADHVLLARGDGLETLSLPRLALAMATPSAAPTRASRMAHAVAAATVGDVVRPGTAVDGAAGQLRGFRIYPRANRGAFAGTGLHGGDLVTAIDGKAIGEMHQNDVQRVFDTVRTASRVNFTVENITGSHEVSVDLSQADADAGASP